jgi:hypothetical protein
MQRLAFLVAALCLAACSTFGDPQTPRQTVYAAKVSFLAAVTVADQYKNLPRCGTGPVVCSSPAVIARLRLGANAADATLDAAEATVMDPKFEGSNTDAAIVAATNAVAAFTAIAGGLNAH